VPKEIKIICRPALRVELARSGAGEISLQDPDRLVFGVTFEEPRDDYGGPVLGRSTVSPRGRAFPVLFYQR
jgi:hypothetical protein